MIILADYYADTRRRIQAVMDLAIIDSDTTGYEEARRELEVLAAREAREREFNRTLGGILS